MLAKKFGIFGSPGAGIPYLNYLYNWGRCIQTPPRQWSTDPKPVCHFDPLLMEIDVSYTAFGLVVNQLLK